MARVLVVEDESLVALDIIQQLESDGYEVVGHALSGEEAIAKAAEQPRPDVILMDINLRGQVDGINAAEAISKTSETPIIFLTAHADETTLQRAKLTRPFGYIIKPFEPNELKINIEIALYRANGAGAAGVAEQGDAAVDEITEIQGGSDQYEILARLPLFEGVEASALKSFAARAAVKHVEGGEYVAVEDEPQTSGFIVLSGRLAVVKSTSEGKELTLDLLSAGDCTGLVALLEDSELDVSIRGQVESRVLTMDAASFLRLVERYPVVYRNALRELAIRNRRTNSLALGLAHARVEKRIISALLSLAPRVGKPSASSSHAKIFMTRKELAELTGTTPETAIRTTKSMEREGLLDLTRPGIIKIIDVQALEKSLVR